ncbi:MAG: PAS domain S-box protein [Leptolyngbya sp. Prado105]|jgi:PAS domain S-box-containing protein|nr:PAS domain S-box protein [Leptolyngbya sp. Prado105]
MVLIGYLSSRLSQTLFERAIAHSAVGIAIADAQHPDFPIVYVNSAFEKQTGYSASALLGRNLRVLHSGECDQPQTAIQTVLKTGNSTTVVFRTDQKNGRSFWCEMTISPIRNAEGKITHWVGMQQDVSDRIQTEQAYQKLQQSNRLLTQVLDTLPQMIFWKDRASTYLGCNTAFAKAAGVETSDQIVGKTDYDLAWATEEATEYRKNDDRIMQARISEANLIEKQTQADGRLIWTETSKIPLVDDENRVIGILGTFKDISVRKAAEEALREREAELRNITSLVPGVLYQYQFSFRTGQGNFTYISPRSLEVFEIAPEVLQNLDEAIWQIAHTDDLARVQASVTKAVLEHQPWCDEYRVILPSGKQIWIRGQSQPGDINEEYGLHYGVFFDISVQKVAELELQQRTQDLEQTLKDLQRTQAQLIQSEKMSSLGQLVAGVAHEINNPVSFISGNLNHAQKYVSDLLHLIEAYEQEYSESTDLIMQTQAEIDLGFLKSDLPNLLISMQTGANRIRQIVLSLRLFSRLDEAEYKEANLHDSIESTLMLLDHRIQKSKIQLNRRYQSLPPVECYAGQLNQVFLNLIENAIDALQTTSDPLLTIHTEAIAQQFVRITISDNGTGITEEIQQRIFDPFFTTKEVGQGTGMGLSISYQIVAEQHRGSLKCDSKIGEGTTFTIEIPTRLKLSA